MGRATVYNKITSPESIKNINPENKQLCSDFLDYLVSIDRSSGTINGYKNDLEIFFCWNLENNGNKPFAKIKKRELARFQGFAMNEWGWSAKRIRRVRSAISSLSNFIENILQDEDDEYEDFRSIIGKIEAPANQAVREKTVIPDEKIDEFLEKLVNEKRYQEACAFALAAMSGARKSELLRFKVEYFSDEYLKYNGALYETPKIKTKGRGKVGKLIEKYVLCEFKKYFDLWMAERKRLGIESEWLFVRKGENGYEQMKVSTLNSWAERFSRELDVDFYWHCMRHYLDTKLLKYNLPENVVQKFFGWSSSDMVSLYNDREANEEFEKFFSKDGIVKNEQGSLSNIQ